MWQRPPSQRPSSLYRSRRNTSVQAGHVAADVETWRGRRRHLPKRTGPWASRLPITPSAREVPMTVDAHRGTREVGGGRSGGRRRLSASRRRQDDRTVPPPFGPRASPHPRHAWRWHVSPLRPHAAHAHKG